MCRGGGRVEDRPLAGTRRFGDAHLPPSILEVELARVARARLPAGIQLGLRRRAERRDRAWKMCGVCCNTLDEWHVKSGKHQKRVAEIMDPTWRLSTAGRSMWMTRRRNTYCAMLVERLGWDFCTKKCKLLDLPPPVISTSPQPPKKTRETYGKSAAEWLRFLEAPRGT